MTTTDTTRLPGACGHARPDPRWRRGGAWLLTLIPVGLLSGCPQAPAPEVVGILEWDRITITAETNDPLIAFHRQEGEPLTQGQPIAQQDPSRLQAQLDKLEAARQQAKARLAELQRGPRPEQIDQARAALKGAKSEVRRARAEFERIKALAERQLTSEETLDGVRAAYEQALARREGAQAALQQLLAGTTREELQQAQAALALTEARLRALGISLERLTLKAPRDGVLDALLFELGERPQAGAVIAVMLSGQAPYARVYVPEPLLAQVRLNGRARVRIDGLADPIPGRVQRISQEAVFTPFFSLTQQDRSRLSYVAEIRLEGERARQLASGLPLQVEFLPTPESEAP